MTATSPRTGASSSADRARVRPDIVAALQGAIHVDNPDADIVVEDHSGYVRIHAPRFLRVTRASLEEVAGQPIPLATLEPAIVASPADAPRRRRRTALVPGTGGLI